MYHGPARKKRKIFGANSIAKDFTHHDKPVDGARTLHELFSNHRQPPPIVIWMESWYQSPAGVDSFESGIYLQTLATTYAKGAPIYAVFEPGSLLKPFAPSVTAESNVLQPYERLQSGVAALAPIDADTYGSDNSLLSHTEHGWERYIISHAFISLKVENKHNFDVFMGVRMRYAEVATGPVATATNVVNSFQKKNWHVMSDGTAFAIEQNILETDMEKIGNNFEGLQWTRIQGRGFEADDPSGVSAAGFAGNPKFMRQKRIEFNLDLNKFRNEMAPHGWDKFDNGGTVSTLTAPQTRILFELIVIPCDPIQALLIDEVASTSVFALDRVVIHDIKLRQKCLFFSPFRKVAPLHNVA